MKSINVRELRNEIPRLRETLAAEQELLLVSNGQPLARILPVTPERHVASLASMRAGMKTLPAGTIARWLREERDAR